MKTETTHRGQGLPLPRLVLLARRLRAITGMDPNVSIKAARSMTPAELEDQLRSFGHWYREHAEHTAQQVENAIYDALEDEENTQAHGARETK